MHTVKETSRYSARVSYMKLKGKKEDVRHIIIDRIALYVHTYVPIYIYIYICTLNIYDTLKSGTFVVLLAGFRYNEIQVANLLRY